MASSRTERSSPPARPRARAVLFDLDHTLFDTDRAERIALAMALRRHGLPFTRSILEAYRHINKRLWEAYQRGEVTPR